MAGALTQRAPSDANALEAWLLGWMDGSVWTPTCAAHVMEALKRARVPVPFRGLSPSLNAAVRTQIMALESPANPALPKTLVSSFSHMGLQKARNVLGDIESVMGCQ